MKIVLDTCLLVKNDINQSKVPYFNYDLLEKLLKDNCGNVYISPFSIPELFALRDYKDADDLMEDLAKDKIGILEFDLSGLKVNFSKYSFRDKYSAAMIYYLTCFLEFFVLQVLWPMNLDVINYLMEKIKNATNKFYIKYSSIYFENFTRFMKEDSILYIIDCIMMALNNYENNYNEKDIWHLIANSKIERGYPFNEVPEVYFIYARFLIYLFSKKEKSGAKKIKLSFGFNDILIAYASKFEYIVLSSDRFLCEYLLKYGNDINKDIIKQLWFCNLEHVNF